MDFQWSAGGCAQEMPTLFFLAPCSLLSSPVLSTPGHASRSQPTTTLTLCPSCFELSSKFSTEQRGPLRTLLCGAWTKGS